MHRSKRSSQGSEPARKPSGFIIQIERPGQALQMDEVLSLLAGTGVQLDESYGPILVNPGLGRFVVRGSGDATARGRAAAIPGVTLFADARIKPAR